MTNIMWCINDILKELSKLCVGLRHNSTVFVIDSRDVSKSSVGRTNKRLMGLDP